MVLATTARGHHRCLRRLQRRPNRASTAGLWLLMGRILELKQWQLKLHISLPLVLTNWFIVIIDIQIYYHRHHQYLLQRVRMG